MRRKNVPYSGPLAPPTVDTSVMPTLVNSAAAVVGLGLVERGDGRLHPAIHVGAVVGVADRGVEIGQLVPVLGDEPGELADPLLAGRAWTPLSVMCSDAPSQRRSVDRSVPEPTAARRRP